MKFTTKDSGDRTKFESGAQRDRRVGKGRFDLISPIVLKRLAELYERGAIKYGDNNYRKGMPTSCFLDSALRHINTYRIGDREEDHLIAAIWNLSGIVETQHLIEKNILKKELDDIDLYG